MTSACLVVVPDGSEHWALRILADAKELYHKGEPPRFFRQSPIFPVVPDTASLRVLESATHWGFFTVGSPLRLIGEASSSTQAKLWFSHGIAAVILPTNDPKEIDALASEWKTDLRAIEVWSLNKGRITSEVKAGVAATVEPEHTRLTDFSVISDLDLKAVLMELQLNLSELASRAAQHLPSYLASLARVVTAINEIISELIWLEDVSRAGPQSVSETMAEMLRKGEPDKINRRRNLRVDTLIQLNSSITYVISQAFHGASPILAHRTLLGAFSLLGVGTAWRAMARFTEYIEDVFERVPVITSIKRSYGKRPGINVRFSEDTAGPGEWHGINFNLDEDMDDVAPATGKPKLVCYSGRLGFGEAEFTATAATQLLHASDSVRWSLMTLSHELLHAHVHAILAVILRLPKKSLSEEAEREHMAAYRPREEQRGEELVGEHLAQSLVFATYEYAKMALVSAAWRRQLNNAKEMRARAGVRKMTDEEFIENCSDKRTLMEEVMVHVLDLHYFYHEDVDLYLDLLWESWATVPAVIEDLENYIIRSVSAVAATLPGKTKERFDGATRILGNAMERLKKRDAGDSVVARVMHHMTDDLLRKGIFARFAINLYIADVTRKFLFSHKAQKALSGDDKRYDPNIHRENGRIHYLIGTGEFSGATVINPVAFLLDRLRRCSERENGLPEEYRSAWTFLACASTPQT